MSMNNEYSSEIGSKREGRRKKIIDKWDINVWHTKIRCMK